MNWIIYLITGFESLNEYDIASILTLYPKIKKMTEYGMTYHQQSEAENKSFQDMSVQIVHKVEFWLQQIYPDEVKILELRYFEHKSFQSIAMACNYKNHSSVVKKHQHIIRKIHLLEHETVPHETLSTHSF